MFKLYKYNDETGKYDFVEEAFMYVIVRTMTGSSGEIFKITSPQGQEEYYDSNGGNEAPTKRR